MTDKLPSETASDKPEFGSEYLRWLDETLEVSNLDAQERLYGKVASEIADHFEKSAFWEQVLEKVKDVDVQYKLKNKHYLINGSDAIKIKIKPWQSFLLKTYRKNILNNSNWPASPEEGWCTPETWFELIRDVARTSVIVKYIDGVPLILDGLREIATKHALAHEAELISRQDGYYSAHFVCSTDCNLTTVDWKSVTKHVSLEIQVTTQIKEVIKTLLHSFYEDKRGEISTIGKSKDVSWDYTSDEFKASYLGHMLHYVESMIIEVRDKKESQK
jgi:hypothetical protein